MAKLGWGALVVGAWGTLSSCGATEGKEPVGTSRAALTPGASWVVSPPGWARYSVRWKGMHSSAALAASTDGFGVAWHYSGGLEFTSFTEGGVVRDELPKRVPNVSDRSGEVAIASTGKDFLVLSGGPTLTGWRVDPLGGFGPAISFGAAVTGFPALVADGADYLAVWNDGTRLLGARIEPGTKTVSPTVLFDDGKVRTDPTLAYGGGHWLLAWGESRGVGRTRLGTGFQKLDSFSSPLLVNNKFSHEGKPLLASDGTSFLLAYAYALTKLNADAVPIGFVQEGLGTGGELIFDGSGYYAAWKDSGDLIYGQTVSLDGVVDSGGQQRFDSTRNGLPRVARLASGERLLISNAYGYDSTDGLPLQPFPIALTTVPQSRHVLAAGTERALTAWRADGSAQKTYGGATISLADDIPVLEPFGNFSSVSADLVRAAGSGSTFLVTDDVAIIGRPGAGMVQGKELTPFSGLGGQVDSNGAGFQLTSEVYSGASVARIEVSRISAAGVASKPSVLCKGSDCRLWDVCPEGDGYSVLWVKGAVNRIDRYSEAGVKIGGGEVDLPFDYFSAFIDFRPKLFVNPNGYAVMWNYYRVPAGLRFFDEEFQTKADLPEFTGKLLANEREGAGETLYYYKGNHQGYRARLMDEGTLVDEERLPALDGQTNALVVGPERLLTARYDAVRSATAYSFVHPGLKIGDSCKDDWRCASGRCDGVCIEPPSSGGAGGEAGQGGAASSSGGIAGTSGVPGNTSGSASEAGASTSPEPSGGSPDLPAGGVPSASGGVPTHPGEPSGEAGHSVGAAGTASSGSGGDEGGCCSIAGRNHRHRQGPALALMAALVLSMRRRRARGKSPSAIPREFTGGRARWVALARPGRKTSGRDRSPRQ